MKTNKPQRGQQATAPMSTSESDEEPTTRTYAAVVAQPGTTTTTPPTQEELRVQHSLEMKAATAQLNELNDQENRRILAAYRQQVRYSKRMKNYMSSALNLLQG
jgi:hypothetical protein